MLRGTKQKKKASPVAIKRGIELCSNPSGVKVKGRGNSG